MQLPSGHSVRENELGDLPTLCSVKIQRPALSTSRSSLATMGPCGRARPTPWSRYFAARQKQTPTSSSWTPWPSTWRATATRASWLCLAATRRSRVWASRRPSPVLGSLLRVRLPRLRKLSRHSAWPTAPGSCARGSPTSTWRDTSAHLRASSELDPAASGTCSWTRPTLRRTTTTWSRACAATLRACSW